MRRRLELARAPLASTKAAAKRLGGSINVAFLTAVAEAAHHYHVDQGQPDRRTARLDGGQHAHQGLRSQRLRARQASRTDRRDEHRRALRTHRRGDHGDQGGRAGIDGRPRRDHVGAADLPAHPGRPPASADRRLRHVQSADVTGTRPTSPGPRPCRPTPSVRSAGWRSTSRCSRTSSTSTWASTSTPRQSPIRRCSPDSSRKPSAVCGGPAERAQTDSAGTAVSSVRTSSSRSATSPLDTTSRLLTRPSA